MLAQRERDEPARETKAAEARAAAAGEEQERAAMAALESERTTLAASVSEQAANVAHLDGVHRSERQATAGERMARERLARQIAQKEEQRAKSHDEAQAIASRLAATERELTAKAAEVDALRRELEPARQELAQFESHERSMTVQLAESNEKLRTAERALVDAENDVRMRRDELETLRESLQAEGFVATAQGEIERLPER